MARPRLLTAEALRPEQAVIVDARGRRAYAEGHIPSAIRIGWEEWCEPAPEHAGPALRQPGYWGALADPDREGFRDRLEAAGLSSDRPIVVYGDGRRTRGREGRVAWMLLYLGAQQVSLLDGGWSAWLAAGGDVSTEVPAPANGRFDLHVDAQRRRTLDELRTISACFIDTRSEEEFGGERDEYLPRRGHVPGAVLVPFATFFGAAGRYTQPSVPTQRPVVAYCEVGVRAALCALLHEIHTGEVIPVYDGSFIEWSLYPDLPIEM